MKRISITLFSLFFLVLGFSAQANNGSVILDQEEVFVQDSGSVQLVRTADSPNKIKIRKNYNYVEQVCVAWENRRLCGQNSHECGYSWRRRCYVNNNGQTVCYNQQYPNYCCWFKEYCTETDDKLMTKASSFRVEFKNASMLEGEDSETFQLFQEQEMVRKPKHRIESEVTMQNYKIKRKRKGVFKKRTRFTIEGTEQN